MDVYKFTADTQIDPDIGTHLCFVNSIKYASPIHYHDFFEIFLVTKGKVLHKVNGEEQYLSEGALVFIRPDDVHYYEYAGNHDCQFINITYSQKFINDVFDYLGDAFCPQRLLSPKLPPTTTLPGSEKDRLVGVFERLHLLDLNDRLLVKIKLKSILAEVIVHYILNHQTDDNKHIPLWLENLIVLMKKKENFSIGLSKMYELSRRTPGHLNKALKQYLSTTPTGYINQIRLDYAKNLLLTTNLSIIDIAMECGFGNLSHFYHLFKKAYNTTPSELRKTRDSA